MITTVLLDGGGVIVDESLYEMIHSEIISEILSLVEPGYTLLDYHDDLDEAVWSFCPNVYKYIIWKHCKGDRAVFDKMQKRHIKAWNDRRPPLVLFDGMREEIKALAKDFKIAIAGQYGHEIVDLLDKSGVLKYFCSQLTQDDFKITKPDPRYLEQITRKIGALPDECIMVGDRIDKDVIPAKQLGMKTILVRTGIHKYQKPRVPFEIPDMELPGIAGLASAAKALSGKLKL
jgi:putative hydrolase of the HAD superfamily